jgi:hypothetical protein
MKSGNLNFLEPSGPLQACNGIAYIYQFVVSAIIRVYNKIKDSTQNMQYTVRTFYIKSFILLCVLMMADTSGWNV